MTQPRRILLITSELFPEFGYPTAGGGVRAAQLYHSLSHAGYPVDLALLKSTAADKNLPEWATQYLYEQTNLDAILEKADPDMVLSEGWEPIAHRMYPDNRLYIADIPGPLVLEKALGHKDWDHRIIRHKVRTLQRLDAVICPNQRVRHYLSAYLTLAGWSPTETERILQIPIGLPDALPERPPCPSQLSKEGQGDEVGKQGLVVFVGGVSWSWHQTGTWIHHLADEFQNRDLGTLRIRMGKHPIHQHEDIFENLEDRLLHHPRIQWEDLTHWEAMVTELCQMPLAIEWSPKHLEREIASTLRLVTCLWCGVPLIVRPHIEIAREIEEYQAGWIVDSWEDLLSLLEALRDNPDELQLRSQNAQKLVQERHIWSAVDSVEFRRLEDLTLRNKAPHEYDHWLHTLQGLELEVTRYKACVDDHTQGMAQLEEIIVNRDQTIGELHQQLGGRLSDIGAREREIQAREREIGRLQGEIARLSGYTEELVSKVKVDHQDAESYRALRQKLLYRIWKRVMG